MKTLIAYATNHGATKKYAEALAKQVPGEVTLSDLKQAACPDPAGFDAVVIGTAIYAGQPVKAAKDFCAKHSETLMSKRLGLFICSMTAEQAEPAFTTAFPAELQNAASAKGLFGGELIMSKLGFAERLIVRVVSKANADQTKYSEEPLAGFVAELTKADA